MESGDSPVDGPPTIMDEEVCPTEISGHDNSIEGMENGEQIPKPRPTSFDILSGVTADEDASKQGSGNAMIVSQRVNSIALEALDGLMTHSEGRSRSSSESSGENTTTGSQVDWAELERSEKMEERTSDDEESVALLLARLEQENNALVTNPKSRIQTRQRSGSRPPSMHQLKMLVDASETNFMRLSTLPSPPPMTELEFWVALVQNYPRTAQRLPTLCSHKIRGGIPAPLRGVVWLSMSGARDAELEDQYDRLCGETSPYETMIGKDIGRSFPGVEMFRDPEGEGQKMLGRVLKCFSLHDPEIGYCQGLGLLVGPLLMQMGEKEAFCVLVRLMEDYDLRSCFLPDLSGLHLRIFQFQRLLHQHLPEVAQHLDHLQVEGAYLSQWFLSFFATTCPLPLLFRIYDVIFAEGASETLMRVALAIMRRNEKRILAFTEFEDVMQLLLSRALWDSYGLGVKCGDELVNDFTSFTKIVTPESLKNLESSFEKAKRDGTSSHIEAAPGIQSAAARFLGRLWQPSTAAAKPSNLSLNVTNLSRPETLRRSASKQSLASTLNSIDAGSDFSGGTLSTAATEVLLSSASSTDSASSLKLSAGSLASIRRPAVNKSDKDLHTQIEDLLNVLNETQRQQALSFAQFEKEKEERREDHRIVRDLINELRTVAPPATSRSIFAGRRRANTVTSSTSEQPPGELPASITPLIEAVEVRLKTGHSHSRQSSSSETKQSLRDSLARSKEQCLHENSKAQSLARQLTEREVELAGAREDLRETRQRLQESHAETQRLESNIVQLRKKTNKPSMPRIDSSSIVEKSHANTAQSETPKTSPSPFSGLREFKLGRTDSAIGQVASPPVNTPTFSKRSSSLATQTVLATENNAPVDSDALLLELVTAKTGEATARQELEELKAKFEAMRRMLGLGAASSGGTSSATPLDAKICPKDVSAAVSPSIASSSSPAEKVPMTPSSSGGFWSWKKRSVSTTNMETAAAH